MENKKFYLALLAFSLLAAGCSAFSQSQPAGIVKSVNGGADWQFSNKLASSTAVSLSGVSVSKMAFDPFNHETVYAGTYNDGLFKSTDSGANWSKLLSKILVYDFVVDSSNSKIIYSAGACVDHGCVLKTVDGGLSWNEIYHEGSPDNTVVRSVALNPLNLNQIVIGTTLGTVIKSNDSGTSWQLVKDFNDRVNKVLWQNGNIYVLLKTKGLYDTANLGASFNEISAGLNKTISVGNLSYSQSSIGAFNQVYVDPTAPSLIYLTTDKGLEKTVDEGKTWTLQNLPVKQDKSLVYSIAVSKQNSSIVFTSIGSTIYKSLDSGATWQTQNINTGNLVNYILIDPQLPQVVYAGIFLSSQ